MKKYLLSILVCCLLPYAVEARRWSPSDAFADSVMRLVFQYAQKVDTTGRSQYKGFAYTKFQIRTNKRNATLMMVPTMYVVAHGGGRRFISEYYNQMSLDRAGKPVNHRLLSVSTIPHRRSTMDQALRYMTPNVYGETLFQENILSPFHRTNRRYYKYSVSQLPFGMAQVYVYPRIKNTQTVVTRAIVNSATGQISMVDFEGEYDMTRFYISVKMGKEGYRSLAPVKCDMRANFHFMGNKISGMYSTVYGLPQLLSDSLCRTLDNAADTALMARVRPIKLNTDEEGIYARYFERKAAADTMARQKKKDFAKDVLWDVIGDNMLNRISQGFGKENQGHFRLSPIFNPLYMGYSQRKGLVYKFDFRGNYSFSQDVELSLQFKGGYSMRQHRFYYRVPFVFKYNDKHEGYLKVEIGNGNRITTNRVARRFLGIPEANDSLQFTLPMGGVPDAGGNVADLPPNYPIISNHNIYEFKDGYLKLTDHWRFTRRLALEAGLVTHRRQAVNQSFYRAFGYPSVYTSVAPALGVEWRPIGRHGPVLTLDYERGVKGLFKSNIDYERVELDAQSIFYASRRRSFSMRIGAGFYTMKGDHWDFVDYTNFYDNNIPGGWNDSWSGEFELLNSQWYNASDYYVRSNLTYEAPMVAVAWFPLIGRYIEKERIYVSGLAVRKLHPYTEWGYGVTTRLMTLGIFAAFKNSTFDGFGCRFGFELFRNW